MIDPITALANPFLEPESLSSKAVRDYLDSDEGRLQVTDYNLEKGFGFQQNRGKKSIKQYVIW
jgi:hypothetical protein